MSLDHEICFVGLARSGNHAVINWLLSLFDVPDVAFYNNIPLFADPRQFLNGLPSVPKCQDPENPAVLSYSFENKPVNAAVRHLPHEWLAPKSRFTVVLILRDPYNYFASVLQRKVRDARKRAAKEMDDSEVQITINPKEIERLQRLWRIHARTFLGEQTIDFSAVAGEHGFLPISYNAWFSYEWYRRQIAAYFNVPYSEKALHVVPPHANGSSFDSRKFQGIAKQMSVLDRWPAWAENPSYRAIFIKPIVKLSRRVFGRMNHAEQALGVAGI